jgi:NAD(P)-dependent dehydrogenase (short-subunit alcohol dehydrogenase family)
VVSIRPHPLTSAYNAAKAGLVTLTRSLALEWSPKVRVNCVTSGLLHVENAAEVYGDDLAKVEATIPMGRLADPSDIAGVCILLASPLARYVTGAELIVDGGGELPAFVVATGGLPQL